MKASIRFCCPSCGRHYGADGKKIALPEKFQCVVCHNVFSIADSLLPSDGEENGDSTVVIERPLSDRVEIVPETAKKSFVIGEKLLGRYTILKELGQGSMGIVYKCMDETAGIEIALKTLPPELSCNDSRMREVKENFRLVHNLHHPNIASTNNLERNPETGDYYLIMECVEGEGLRSWLNGRRAKAQLTLPDILPILKQTAAALDYAHSQRIIHRDIKPGNIMLDSWGNVKILDFGLAMPLHITMNKDSMRRRCITGTGPYMSPEQWQGRPQNSATDQYALAAMTYEMLSGHLPFDNDDIAVLRDTVLTKEPEKLKGFPENVINAVSKGLSKNPGLRFSGCGSFVQALSGNGQSAAPNPVSSTSGSSQNPKKHWMPWAVVSAILVAAAGLGAWRVIHIPQKTKIAELEAPSVKSESRENVLKNKSEEPAAVQSGISPVFNQAENNENDGVIFSTDRRELKKFPTDYRSDSYTVPSGVEKIAESAFAGNDVLTRIEIPASVHTIGNSAFRDCGKLSEITIFSRAVKFGPGTFLNCSRLRSIALPHGTTEIAPLMFRGCSALEEILIPESVKKIGREAFRNCTNLTYVRIPRKVTDIEEEVFDSCSSLAAVFIGAGVERIGEGAFRDCIGLEDITFSHSLKNIGPRAFSGCRNLNSLAIPSGCILIGERAFNACINLNSVVIPKSVAYIGEEAFGGCEKLASVSIANDTASISSSAFHGCIFQLEKQQTPVIQKPVPVKKPPVAGKKKEKTKILPQIPVAPRKIVSKAAPVPAPAKGPEPLEFSYIQSWQPDGPYAGSAGWIWEKNKADFFSTARLSREFVLKAMPRRGELFFTADDEAQASVNGFTVGNTDDWSKPRLVNITAYLQKGINKISVTAKVRDPANYGILAEARFLDFKGRSAKICTDSSWKDSRGKDAVIIAPYGEGIWGHRLYLSSGEQKRKILKFILPNGSIVPLQQRGLGTLKMQNPYSRRRMLPKYAAFQNFWLCDFEVSGAEYMAVRSRFRDSFRPVPQNSAAEVTWDEANEFCRQLNQITEGQRPKGYSFLAVTTGANSKRNGNFIVFQLALVWLKTLQSMR